MECCKCCVLWLEGIRCTAEIEYIQLWAEGVEERGGRENRSWTFLRRRILRAG